MGSYREHVAQLLTCTADVSEICSMLARAQGARIIVGLFFGIVFLVLCCFWQFGSPPPPFVAIWQHADDAWPPGRPFLAKSWEQNNL